MDETHSAADEAGFVMEPHTAGRYDKWLTLALRMLHHMDRSDVADGLEAEFEALRSDIKTWKAVVKEDCETGQNCREIAASVLGESYVTGDSHCVPPLEEIVERLCDLATNNAEASRKDMAPKPCRCGTLQPCGGEPLEFDPDDYPLI